MLNHGTAIDISNYTGRLSGEQLLWLKDNCDVVIVRLSTEDGGNQREIAAQQVSALADAGVPWQGYLWCYWQDSPFEHWKRATELLPTNWPGYFQSAIWLDMEDICRPAVRVIDWVMAYSAMLKTEGFIPGVYTGQWWMDLHKPAFEEPAAIYWRQLPLWLAHYGIDPTCTPTLPYPFRSIAMHQYQAVNVGDPLSSYDLSLICNLE